MSYWHCGSILVSYTRGSWLESFFCNHRGVLVLLIFYWAPDIVKFVLGRFSHFNIAIAYSNSTFCGVWTPSFCEFTQNFSKTSTPQIFLLPANEVCEGYVFTGVCLCTLNGHTHPPACTPPGHTHPHPGQTCPPPAPGMHAPRHTHPLDMHNPPGTHDSSWSLNSLNSVKTFRNLSFV